MYSVLRGLNVVECSSFVAGPTCGLYLLQMGAEVVRIDNIGGGPDFNRWPRYKGGLSLYWEGLNKGKKSVALDLASPEGKELAVRIATAPGPERGLFLTNFPLNGFLSHANLVKSRADLITVSMRAARQVPIYDAVSHLVYVTHGDDVRNTIVNGKVLMRDRRLSTLNEAEVLAQARALAQKVRDAVQ